MVHIYVLFICLLKIKMAFTVWFTVRHFMTGHCHIGNSTATRCHRFPSEGVSSYTTFMTMFIRKYHSRENLKTPFMVHTNLLFIGSQENRSPTLILRFLRICSWNSDILLFNHIDGHGHLTKYISKYSKETCVIQLFSYWLVPGMFGYFHHKFMKCTSNISADLPYLGMEKIV